MRLLPPMHAFKVFFSSLWGHNAPLKTVASQGRIAGLERQFVRVPSSSTDVVSFLQRGTPDGRRVIFVHGTPGNARGWADYLLTVPPGHRHIAVDRLGYGLSKPGHAVVSLTRQAQAIAPLLEEVKGRKAILVGHSSGAAVALQIVLDHAEMVGGLLLLAGAADPDLEEASWIQSLGTLKPIASLLSRPINNANQELLGLKSGLIAQAERLKQISIPVSIVHGDRDPLVPIANVYYLQQMLKNASLDTLILKGKDHFLPWHSKSSVDLLLKRLIHHVEQTELQISKEPTHGV